MENYKILTLEETTIIPDDGSPPYQLPTVPGAAEVDYQMNGLYTCKGKKIAGVNTKYTHELYAVLQKITGNQYIIFSDEMNKIDPLSTGVDDVKNYQETWPWEKVERTYDEDGKLIDEVFTGEKILPTVIADVGMSELLKTSK